MGFLSRVRKALRPAAVPSDGQLPTPAHEPRFRLQVPAGGSPLVALAGTTTLGRDAIDALLVRRAARLPAYLELEAVLEREPDNPVDSYAIAVLVEGDRIGYLPGYLAKQVDFPVGSSLPLLVQLFAKEQDGRTRALAWAWLDETPPRWEHGPDDWPAITREEKRAADHIRSRTMVADAISDGGRRAAQFRPGMVDGVHFLELVEPIKQLKREGRNEEALQLCYVAIAGVEGEHASEGLTPPPWYTEQAAIVLRKLKRRDEEIAVLRRYLALLPPKSRDGSSLAQRLSKIEGNA
ncbi:HIRAN domain-containing protein [Cellulosimicrobium cellulans]|uniref:HIRAN domain-containing protein n=1 Tax=Cellulosimicrobium cellulans TaxID=1710 RepID=UPI001963EABF|nr:HIRAN domain-containing protein [Cellulosimicrobium cellulans]MBN0042227.1 HIRAN domain-containing protein [Cellulosimicrobium cellulans]